MSEIRKLVLFAMFVAITVVLFVTPLGLIPLGAINATTMHLPVIIGAIILGPKFGAALGGVFGILSLIKNTIAPVATSFAFSPMIPVPGTEHGSPWALAVAIIPRVLIGVTSYYAYVGMKKLVKNDALSIGVGAFVGSMTNTVLVFALIYLLFKNAYAGSVNLAGKTLEAFIGGTVITNSIPEAIVAVIISVAVCKALKAYSDKK